MTKYLICDSAPEKWGKSAILLKLIEVLEKHITDEPYKGKYGADRTVVCDVNGSKILIQTQGDPGTTAFEDTDFYMQSHSDIHIYICAVRYTEGHKCRVRTSPIEQAEKIAQKHGFNSTIKFRNFHLQNALDMENCELNEASVAGIVELINKLTLKYQ